MTQSFQAPGNILSVAAPYDRLTSGLGAKIGAAIFGVSCDTVLSGAVGQFETEGVHLLAKTSAQAWVLGDRIFWDDSNKRCDNVPTVGMLIGYATVAAANPSSTGYVKLGGSASDLYEGVQAAIAAEATADGSDAATTQALANALKAKLNVLLASLRVSGLIAP